MEKNMMWQRKKTVQLHRKVPGHRTTMHGRKRRQKTKQSRIMKHQPINALISTKLLWKNCRKSFTSDRQEHKTLSTKDRMILLMISRKTTASVQHGLAREKMKDSAVCRRG